MTTGTTIVSRLFTDLSNLRGRSEPELFARAIRYMRSAAGVAAAKADLASLPRNAQAEDRYFQKFPVPGLCAGRPQVEVAAWEALLAALREADEPRYLALHKGTPFYFLAVRALECGDLQRALSYLDAAVGDDEREVKANWHMNPAGRFLSLDTSTRRQAGYDHNKMASEMFEEAMREVKAAGGAALSIPDYRSHLVDRAIRLEPPLRSVVTALLTFIIEFRARQTGVGLTAGVQGGTGEPVFLHLFRGCVVFETLLRQSGAWQGSPSSKLSKLPTLDDFMKDPTMLSALGLSARLQGIPNCRILGDLLAFLPTQAASKDPWHERAFRVTWRMRNMVGHSLAHSVKPTSLEYKALFALVLGAICEVILRLYEPPKNP